MLIADATLGELISRLPDDESVAEGLGSPTLFDATLHPTSRAAAAAAKLAPLLSEQEEKDKAEARRGSRVLEPSSAPGVDAAAAVAAVAPPAVAPTPPPSELSWRPGMPSRPTPATNFSAQQAAGSSAAPEPGDIGGDLSTAQLQATAMYETTAGPSRPAWLSQAE